MPKADPVTSCDFFINTAALEAGLTQQFWYQAYLQFLRQAESDTSAPGFEMYDFARTVRIPFHHKYIDVLVRCQPEPREHRIIRLTAFPAGDERQGPQLSDGTRILEKAVPHWKKPPYWISVSDGSGYDRSSHLDRNFSSSLLPVLESSMSKE